VYEALSYEGQNWKTWERRAEKLDYQAFHGLIIKPFDNQTVFLP
jgi:hypothetical protein